jgi:hypothetical protein
VPVADEVTERRTFHVIGTGWPVPEGAAYVGTVINPAFVWHVFEVQS